MEENKIKLSENVVVIDTAFLNFVVTDLKKYFETILNRSLKVIDLSELAMYLTLDAGLEGRENNVQFLFVYDQDSIKLECCTPSDLKEELNGTAFNCKFGEYTFASVPSEGMVTREELFFDLLNIVLDSKDVKRVFVVSFNEEYGERVIEVLNKIEDKEVMQFRMDEPEYSVKFRWDMLAYPVMQALGIKGDEL